MEYVRGGIYTVCKHFVSGNSPLSAAYIATSFSFRVYNE